MRTTNLRWWKTVVSLGLVTGCATEDLELGQTDQDVDVVWANTVGVMATGNSLTKTAATGWGNAGAVSTLSVSNDMFVDFTTAEVNLGKSIGLSVGDTDQNYTDIDYSIHLSANGTMYVYEAGVLAGNFGAYAANDAFRVQSVEREVKYLRNGTAFYTSGRASQYPLLVDTALFHQNSTINTAVASDFTFDHVLAADITGTSLRKTAADGWGNSGAITSRTIKAGDGFVQFSTNENIRGKSVGLSLVDTDTNFNTIKWSIHLSANTSVQVHELGVLKGTFGNYVAGDVFRVQIVGTQVQYAKNGTVFYTSAVAPQYPVFGDIAMFHINTTVTNVVLDDTFWTAATGADPIGGKLVGTAATGWGNSGAVSLGSIAAGTGFVEFRSRETNKSKACGLTTTSTSNSYTDINFAISLSSNGGVFVYENGVLRGSFGTYTTTDLFRVEINAGGMVEYKKNGTVFFTSAAAPTYPLIADAALFSAGATVDAAIIDTP
jgi:hypothetical protein